MCKQCVGIEESECLREHSFVGVMFGEDVLPFGERSVS